MLCDVMSFHVVQYYSALRSTTKYYSVLQSTTPVLLCTTKNYSSTTKYYSVLQSTNPVLLRTTKYYASTTKYYSRTTPYYKVLLCTTKYYSSTTKYYSSTTKYYKVLLQYYKVLLQYYEVLRQYYSVLQSTTPVLLRTTKYYASTTLYYKVLLQYYKVLLRTTKYYKVLLQYYTVLLRTTKYYAGTTKYYKVVLCTTSYYASTTLYYKVLLQYYKVLLQVVRLPQKVTLELHQILRLSSKMTPMLDPGHIWNVIYNARSNKCHPPTSPNTAPATQNDSHAWSSSHMKRHLQCAEQQVSLSNLTKYCACHTERLACLIVVTYETSFTMRGATGVTIQPHQILRLPHRMTRMLDRRHIWNVIYNARSNRCHHPTSPNTAPATQNDSHAWSSSHMKRHLQCAEQQVSPSNLTKYCACHEKWHCKISEKISKNRWNVISNAGTIREWSENYPSMKTQTATRLATEVTFRAHHEHFLLKNTTFRAQSYIQTFTKCCACHEE